MLVSTRPPPPTPASGSVLLTLVSYSVLLYDTKVGERWGHNYDLVSHEVWYRAAQNCEAMIAAGHDPLRVVCDHAHKRGMNFLAHLLLGLHHKPASRVTDGRQADFTTNHPEWMKGEDTSDKEGGFGVANQLSYAHAGVRADRLAVAAEVLTDYPTDGIEINFLDCDFRNGRLGPLTVAATLTRPFLRTEPVRLAVLHVAGGDGRR